MRDRLDFICDVEVDESIVESMSELKCQPIKGQEIVLKLLRRLIVKSVAGKVGAVKIRHYGSTSFAFRETFLFCNVICTSNHFKSVPVFFEQIHHIS